MPKATRIVKWRQKREQRSRRTGRTWLKLGGVGLIIATVLTVLSVLAVSGGTAVAYTTFTQGLPDYSQIETLGRTNETFETTKIYGLGADQNGDGTRDWVLIYEVIDPLGGDRQWVEFAQLPQDFVDATIAIEDRTFWTNEGFDLQGIGRAFYEYVWLGGAIQGGSSITQQVVKNNLIEPERRVVQGEPGWDDYRRKIEEVLLANRMSQEYTKEQIIEWYVNSNFYGNLAYGIEAAARVYFNKTAAELTLPEAAMLAAIPQSPALNPIDAPDQAKTRQELVLDAMFRDGLISREELVAAKFTPLPIASSLEERFDIIAPHYALRVRQELEQQFGAEQMLRGGLRVYTALDLELQSQAECVARAHVARLSGALGSGLPADEASSCPAIAFLPTPNTAELGLDRQVNNAAVVIIDPRTGELKAMVGSLNYWDDSIDGSFNVAADGLRQPGSSFKPFTYLTAFAQGYTPATMVLDVETDFGTEYNGVAYVPQNYDRLFRGPQSIRQALGNSYNVPAVEVMSWVGVDNVIRTAHKMGITSLDGGPNQYGLSLTLGGGEVRPLDMAYAFSVLANGGQMIGQPVPEARQRLGFRSLEPVTILRVEDRNGVPIYEYNQPQQQQILTAPLAYLMNDILSDGQARCAGFGCPNVLELPGGRPAAVKTGTTNNYRDGWTVGYTPQLVTAVWVGNTDNTPMDNVPGSRGAAPIWHAIMAYALRDAPIETWSQPPGVAQRTVCRPSGLLSNGICPTVNELFLAGTEPTLIDNMYQQFQVNRETGRLATIYTPQELVEIRTYVVYPDRAADWVRENEIDAPPTEYDTIDNPNMEGRGVALGSPRPFAYVSGVAGAVAITGTVQMDDFAYYRLAYFEGLTPGQLRQIGEPVTEPKENETLGLWDVADLEGLYTLVLTAVRNDGTFEELSAPVTIDNTPPTAVITAPRSDQTFSTNDEFILIQTEVSDDISLDRVAFYVGGSGVPFAISTVPPHTGRFQVYNSGCFSFRVVATDAAGNEGESTAVGVCVEE